MIYDTSLGSDFWYQAMEYHFWELLLIFVFHLDAWATKNKALVDTHGAKIDDNINLYLS